MAWEIFDSRPQSSDSQGSSEHDALANDPLVNPTRIRHLSESLGQEGVSLVLRLFGVKDY